MPREANWETRQLVFKNTIALLQSGSVVRHQETEQETLKETWSCQIIFQLVRTSVFIFTIRSVSLSSYLGEEASHKDRVSSKILQLWGFHFFPVQGYKVHPSSHRDETRIECSHSVHWGNSCLLLWHAGISSFHHRKTEEAIGETVSQTQIWDNMKVWSTEIHIKLGANFETKHSRYRKKKIVNCSKVSEITVLKIVS